MCAATGVCRKLIQMRQSLFTFIHHLLTGLEKPSFLEKVLDFQVCKVFEFLDFTVFRFLLYKQDRTQL